MSGVVREMGQTGAKKIKNSEIHTGYEALAGSLRGSN
jgi:hypothetical protein